MGDELYAELDDIDELDEETSLNVIEDQQRVQEDEIAEKAEQRSEQEFRESLTVPAGVTFDPVDHLDNLPPPFNGNACASSGNGLDNFPSVPPLFGGKSWPLL